MTTEKLRAIVIERLGNWGEQCGKVHATPVILIAIGHDHNSGQVHIFVPEDLPLPLEEWAKNVAASVPHT